MTTLIEARSLARHYPVGRTMLGRPKALVRAADGLSFRIERGEVLGLVGESGSGKSTVGRAMMMLDRPTGGQVLYEGTDLVPLGHAGLHPYRRRMQMIFQDPYSSLNPRMTVEESLTMPLRFHQPGLSAADRRQRAGAVMETVGLPVAMLGRYPHEFSGGQRQRIGIARALIVDPEFIVADEAVSALDVSVQAQVLNLLAELRKRLDLTMLFITHDLAVVGHIADRVAVMYLGNMLEVAPTAELFARSRHPYTHALLSSAPGRPRSAGTQAAAIAGEPPSPINPPSGCVFRTRCPHALPACAGARPALAPTGTAGHLSACIRDDLVLPGPASHSQSARN